MTGEAEESMDDEFRGRCRSAEKEEWKRAAKVTKRSLSDWIRLTLNEAAAKIKKD